MELGLIPLTIGLALIFDFINGFHDAANSIATIVSTRVLKPNQAVWLAAFFNFAAFLIFGLEVAKTIGTGVVQAGSVNPEIIFAGLMGAIIWDLWTWYKGIPTSSSHALIGGLVGATWKAVGWEAIQFKALASILGSIFIAPILAFFIGRLALKIVFYLYRKDTPHRADLHFRRLQLISAALSSLGHGGNDAQKTMGLIALILYSGGYQSHWHVPFWAVIACHTALGLGTLLGGWRIVKTLGMKLTKLRPPSAFSAEAGAATTLFIATRLGVPVSTTQTIAGAIIGVGFETRPKGVRWQVGLKILQAWFFTIPASALVGAITQILLSKILHGHF
jgi:inorganic phosphate transporter, PiT family